MKENSDASIPRGTRATPNDPKLSDGGGLAQPVPDAATNENCPKSDAAPLAEAQAVTARSRSLQRMVRRCGALE